MDDFEIETKICGALALMHSTNENSGRNLRLMLDSLIQKKFGIQKTVTSRVSKTFLNEVESCESNDFLKYDTLGELQSVSPERIKSIKIFTTDSDDSEQKDNVPRISIPDEESEESAAMEEEAKLSFILLECQNCSEIYQPLSNQPSIHIDNFNPELSWLCKKCSENSNERKKLKFYSNKRRVSGKSSKPTTKILNLKRKLLEDT